MLFRGRRSIAEVPFPRSYGADGKVFESDEPTLHVDHLKTPLRFDFASKRAFKRHKFECAQLGRVSVHGVLWGEIPKPVISRCVDVVVVDNGPIESDALILAP